MFTGCRVSDIRTFTIRVPEMTQATDEIRIRKALTPLNGLQHNKTAVDLTTHQVTVTYDSMIVAHKNIELAIVEAGYTANNIPASTPVPKK